MNLVFMNSLEKLHDDLVLQGQISICEEHGKWQIFWSEHEPSGKVKQEDWYEGTAWDEMMTVFRYRISEKLGDGFLPVIEGVTDHFELPKGREEVQQMILCYSDNHRNEELYEELREWRRATAVKEHKAAYFIATNRLFGLISALVPYTREELKQIPGFGAHRLENYGDAILAITSKYKRDTEFPLDWVAERLDRREFTLWYYRQKQLKLRKEGDLQQLRRELLTQIEQGASLMKLSELSKLTMRETIQWVEQLESEGYDLDQFVQREVESMPQTLCEKALEAFAELGDQYLKPVLKAVYGEQLPDGMDVNTTYAQLRILRIHYRRAQDSLVQT